MNNTTTQNCGVIPAGTVTGRWPTVALFCEKCGRVHNHEDQGLRATGHGCLTVHHLTFDELDVDRYPRS